MAFSKDTEVLTMDEDWLPISSITPFTKLWGGKKITSILSINEHTSSLIQLKGKFNLCLTCSLDQILQEYKSLKPLLAKDCLRKKLEFIQDGEERIPLFKSLTDIGTCPCISLTTNGIFFIKANNLTGLTIPFH